MIKIFLISGKAESGKNTVADFIANYYMKIYIDRNNFIRGVAFADEVKSIARSIGWNGVKDSKGRELLQQIGAWGRYYNSDIWVQKINNLILKDINTFKDCMQNKIFCITDVRYPNEIERVQEFFDKYKDVEIHKIRIERNTANHLTKRQQNDSSETALDSYNDWDKVFLNDKDLEDLNAEVVDWLKTLD